MGKGKVICRVNNLALLMEDYGQGAVFVATIVNEEGDILGTTQIDIAHAVFLERCLGSAISEVLGHYVRENWYGEEDKGEKT